MSDEQPDRKDPTDDELLEYGLGIRRRDDGEVVVYELRGLIGSNAYQSFMGLVRREYAAGKRLFVFDLSAVTYVNSSGLGFLMSCAIDFKKAGSRLVLCELQPRLQTLFKVSGKLPIEMHETCDDALREIRS